MSSRLKHQLSKKSQRILALASSLGAYFLFDTLQIMANKVALGENGPLGKIEERDLDEIFVNNYLQIVNRGNNGVLIRFSHDRIRALPLSSFFMFI